MTKPPLHKHVSIKLVVILLGLVVVFNVFIMPFLVGDKNAIPIDLQFAYTPEKAYELINSYSNETRHSYAVGEMTFDIAYPIVYTLFMSVALMLLYPNKWKIAWLPYVVFVADMFENIGIVTMLLNYPQELISIAWITSTFSTLKWTLVIGVAILIFYGLLAKIWFKKIRNKIV